MTCLELEAWTIVVFLSKTNGDRDSKLSHFCWYDNHYAAHIIVNGYMTCGNFDEVNFTKLHPKWD